MSILQGRLTVIVATVVASGMIVLTGNGIAEDKDITETSAGKTVSSKLSDGISQRLEKQMEDTVNKSSVNVDNNTAPAPPPGPFLNNKGVVVSTQKSLLAPIAPKGPINLSKEPEQRANSVHLKEAPLLSRKVVEPKSDLNEPLFPTKPSMTSGLHQNEAQIDQGVKQASSSDQAPTPAQVPKLKSFSVPAPVAPQNTAKQPKVNSVDVPIWLERGNVTKQAPNSPSKSTNQQKQSGMAMPNMGWNNNYPTQQYIYMPVPMMPSNMLPPQAPVFNGNIIPPSNYWGGNMQPNYAPNIVIKKESPGSVSAPVQKGNE